MFWRPHLAKEFNFLDLFGDVGGTRHEARNRCPWQMGCRCGVFGRHLPCPGSPPLLRHPRSWFPTRGPCPSKDQKPWLRLQLQMISKKKRGLRPHQNQSSTALLSKDALEGEVKRKPRSPMQSGRALSSQAHTMRRSTARYHCPPQVPFGPDMLQANMCNLRHPRNSHRIHTDQSSLFW